MRQRGVRFHQLLKSSGFNDCRIHPGHGYHCLSKWKIICDKIGALVCVCVCVRGCISVRGCVDALVCVGAFVCVCVDGCSSVHGCISVCVCVCVGALECVWMDALVYVNS